MRSRSFSATAEIVQSLCAAAQSQGDARDGYAFTFVERGGCRERSIVWREAAPVSRHQSRSAANSWAYRSPTSAGDGCSALGEAAGGDQGAGGIWQNLARFELVRVASRARRLGRVAGH